MFDTLLASNVATAPHADPACRLVLVRQTVRFEIR
jgi:hypothetical protein